MIMRTRRRATRSSRRMLAKAIACALIALSAGACGRGLFSSSSSSSSGAASGAGTARSVYVTNFADGTVSSLSRNGTSGALTNPAPIAAGSSSGPVGLAVTPSHTALYAANAADKLIEEFTLSSNGNPSPLNTIATGTNPRQPVVTNSGKFAYSINSGGSISEYTVDATSGVLAANSTASTTSGLTLPISGVATNSFLYVTDQGAGVALTFKINSNGTLAAGPASTASLGVPNQILIDPNGTWVFVSDATAGKVSLLKVSGSGLNFINSVPTSAPGTAEAGLAYLKIGSNIFIYCADQAANSVSVFLFDPSTQTLTLTSSMGSLNAPMGLAVSPTTANHFLYVANSGDGTITQFSIDSTTGALTNVGSVATENPANAASESNSILITK
jgi:6-phosphogluconolactonase (cycloisomerase 2 family)